jgi:hypothetical protein
VRVCVPIRAYGGSERELQVTAVCVARCTPQRVRRPGPTQQPTNSDDLGAGREMSPPRQRRPPSTAVAGTERKFRCVSLQGCVARVRGWAVGCAR